MGGILRAVVRTLNLHPIMKCIILFSASIAALSLVQGNQVSKSQRWAIESYKVQTQIITPEDALINTETEPDLTEGFVDLYNGKDLTGWTPRGGNCTFEARGKAIVGTTVQGSPSTYLSTNKEDYQDFIFTDEIKWAVDGNSGVMFRAQRKPSGKDELVFGPQCEVGGIKKGRNWSGGIYGQSAGAWRYPLWLEAHEEVRDAIKGDARNRVTIQAVGNNVKTWINGIPAANWEDDEYPKGYFGLQVHAGKQGEVHFRNLKVKELK